MAKMKFIATNKDKLSTIDVKDGQVIFSRDERIIYLDSESTRRAFKPVESIDTEANRLEASAIDGCYYLVEESNLLYFYKNKKWNCLNESELIFTKENMLPEQGEEDKIYITENTIKKWDEALQTYTKIGCGDTMSELHWGSIQ